MPNTPNALPPHTFVNVRGAVAPDGTVSMRFGVPLRPGRAASAGVMRKEPTGLDLQVVADDRVLATWHPVLIDPSNVPYEGHLPAGRPVAFHVRIPIAGNAQGIVARVQGQASARLEIPTKEPVFHGDPEVAVAGDAVTVRWKMRGDSEGLLYAVRASSDGEVWTTLAVHVPKTGLELPVARLPGGTRIHLSVEATNGVHRVAKRLTMDGSQPLVPELAMLQPIIGNTYMADRPIRLEAIATLRGARFDPNEIEYLWRVDGDDVGKGRRAWWMKPDAGKHRIGVMARFRGGDATAYRGIVVRGADNEERTDS